MTTDISADGLVAVYEALNASPTGRIAVKLSTGEPGSNYLRLELIGELVQSFDSPTIVECNTAYGGSRANTAMHYQVAEDHGYTALAAVDIMDEDGSMTLPVTGGTNLTENYVGAHFADYDYFVVLSHFKGHAMAGYGGAIVLVDAVRAADGDAAPAAKLVHLAVEGEEQVRVLALRHDRAAEALNRLVSERRRGSRLVVAVDAQQRYGHRGYVLFEPFVAVVEVVVDASVAEDYQHVLARRAVVAAEARDALKAPMRVASEVDVHISLLI